MTYRMASLTKKILKGRPYYYLRECKRVNGKPKIVWQQYIGTPEELVRRLTEPEPAKACVIEYGASTACLRIAQEMLLKETVDNFVPKRTSGGPSVGEYILIATLNRCIAPRSKAALGKWYKKTILPKKIGVKASQLSSQRFWDNMDRIDEEMIMKIENEISKRIVTRFNLTLDCLLFDATNFFTFIDTFNENSDIAQRGKSKEGRASLRIIGLALMVTSDGRIPLFHHTYPGNQHDATTFGSVSERLANRCRDLSDGVCDMTLIFDKGNNSKDNLDAVEDGPFHFVGSLVPTHHSDLLDMDRRSMRRLDEDKLPAVWSYRIKKEVFGVDRTVLVTFNQELFDAQYATLKREINKRREKFRAVESSLRDRRDGKITKGKKPTFSGIENRVKEIVKGRHMKDLFPYSLRMGKSDIPLLRWDFNDKEWKKLKRNLLGKTILFTDREEWSDEQIVLGYRAQAHVENAFKDMKNVHFLSFRPTYHWSDQKLRVHAFYCVQALAIISLLRRELYQAKIKISIENMMEQLTDIKEVSLLYPTSKAEKYKATKILSEMDDEQKSIAKVLRLVS